MKTKLILLGLVVLIFSSCISMVKEEKLQEWAAGNGYLLAEDCPKVPEVPKRLPLEHPERPILEVYDEDGNPIPITEQYLMEIIIKLFGTVEKYQYLAEIYEREYLNADGKIMPDLTLDELKALYLERINAIDAVPVPEEEPIIEGEYPTTGATIDDLYLSGEYITVEGFALIVDAFNSFQETGEQ